MSRRYRTSNATRTAVHELVRRALGPDDAARVAQLNERLGICPECGKWALKHHSHCSRRYDPVDVARQRRIIASNTGVETGDDDDRFDHAE